MPPLQHRPNPAVSDKIKQCHNTTTTVVNAISSPARKIHVAWANLVTLCLLDSLLHCRREGSNKPNAWNGITTMEREIFRKQRWKIETKDNKNYMNWFSCRWGVIVVPSRSIRLNPLEENMRASEECEFFLRLALLLAREIGLPSAEIRARPRTI